MREFIVEADGGSRGNPGPAGYGSVVIDAATGETLVERAEYIGIATNNVAEYRGLLAGLRAARELDPAAPVRVRMDSKLVVEQMSGRWKIKHPGMKPLAAEAAGIYPPGQVTYEWIPREHNKHADRLANEAMDAGKRGEQWDPGASMAALNAPSPVSPAPRTPSGPPGDATAGAAKARQALAEGRAGSTPALGDAAGTATVTGTGTGTAATSDADRRAARTLASPSPAPASGQAQPAVGWGAAPDLGAPATFVLLRHGETPLTPEKRFSGSGGSDPALSAVGREQAER
ncbi:reverse transcriptase-like protein, partial [Streptomyces bobili]